MKKYQTAKVRFSGEPGSTSVKIMSISSENLRRAAAIKDKIEQLQRHINRMLAQPSSTGRPHSLGHPRRPMPEWIKAKISKAHRRNWRKRHLQEA